MDLKLIVAAVFAASGCATAMAADATGWWNEAWRFRTTIERPSPYRDDCPRPVEAAIDFGRLLQQGGIAGDFDPASIRVVDARGQERPCAYRSDFETGRQRTYVTWMAEARPGSLGAAHVYFDTRDRAIPASRCDPGWVPSENLLVDGGFEEQGRDWHIEPSAVARFGRFAHTTGARSLEVVVDEQTPADVPRTCGLSQKVDVDGWAGQEMFFACDLFAERAAYGAPVCIEVRQFRKDGSRILECAVDPRWLTLELAQGQLVRLGQRGRFSPEAASAEVQVRLKCFVQDEDTHTIVTGPESRFAVWIDRIVLRAGERWPWPSATHAGFVEGALPSAPLNRGFHFTAQRRLAFNGASEGTLTAGQADPGPTSVHWGLGAGTIEFWCRPDWDSDDGIERVFFSSPNDFEHWAWYRVPGVDAAAGKHRLVLQAGAGTCIDAVLLLDQTPAMDRAAMNLFQNWNYAKPLDSGESAGL